MVSSITLELKRSIFKGAPSSFCTMEEEREFGKSGFIPIPLQINLQRCLTPLCPSFSLIFLSEIFEQIWFYPCLPTDKPRKRVQGVLLIYRGGSHINFHLRLSSSPQPTSRCIYLSQNVLSRADFDECRPGDFVKESKICNDCIPYNRKYHDRLVGKR